jgi:hypothetical protein
MLTHVISRPLSSDHGAINAMMCSIYLRAIGNYYNLFWLVGTLKCTSGYIGESIRPYIIYLHTFATIAVETGHRTSDL